MLCKGGGQAIISWPKVDNPSFVKSENLSLAEIVQPKFCNNLQIHQNEFLELIPVQHQKFVLAPAAFFHPDFRDECPGQSPWSIQNRTCVTLSKNR